MSIQLRKKACAGGKKSLYLDIYHNNERHYEFLKIYLSKAITPQQTQSNKEALQLAESIRAKRELDLQASDYDYQPAFKKNINFIEFYEKQLADYQNKDIRLMKCSLFHFKKFAQKKGFENGINSKLITEDLCRQFRSYLEQVVNGETVNNYFTKFKRVINRAFEDNILTKDYSKGVKNTKSDGLKKNILDIDEIQKLAEATCSNETVKRAFLFSLNTGLRWVDVKALTWCNIDKKKLKFTQRKTKNSSKSSMVAMDLNQNALKVIGERGKPDDLVFNLPSHAGALKNLDTWVKSAGIEKHISWHCARHSFAVNLLDSEVVGADIKTVSTLLGHASIKHTEKYTHFLFERGKKAVNSLPEINF